MPGVHSQGIPERTSCMTQGPVPPASQLCPANPCTPLTTSCRPSPPRPPQTFRSKEISKSNVVDDMVESNAILYG